jgi:20S proteasome subunit beta 7
MMTIMILGSYGSLARFRDERRLFPVGKCTVLGSGGDISDYQYVQHHLTQMLIEDYYVEDGHHYGPDHIYEYMSRLMYQRRSKMNPLWNTFVIAGCQKGKK